MVAVMGGCAGGGGRTSRPKLSFSEKQLPDVDGEDFFGGVLMACLSDTLHIIKEAKPGSS
jgi:hypothetical protein